MRPVLRRWPVRSSIRSAALLPLILLGACSSGGGGDSDDGGGGGIAPQFSVDDLVGSWNLFMNSDPLGGVGLGSIDVNKTVDSMQVTRSGTDALQLTIGAGSDAIVLDATLISNQRLTVSGIKSSGQAGATDFSSQIFENGTWNVSGDSMIGAIEFRSVQGTTTSDKETRQVEARRVDTSRLTDPLVGTWEWTLDPRSDPGCTTPDVFFANVHIRHFAGERFLAAIEFPKLSFEQGFSGQSFDYVVEIERNGTELKILGRDKDRDLIIDVTENSLVRTDDELSGNVRIEFEFGPSCVTTFSLQGRRGGPGELFAPAGRSFFPYVQDVTGARRVMLFDPQTIETFDIGFIDSDIQAITLRSFAGIAYGGRVDSTTGEVTGIGFESLVYLDDKALKLVDLEIQANQLGEQLVPEPVLASIPAIANPDNLRVFSDLGDLAAVATIRENQGSLRIFEISKGGSFETTFLAGGESLFTAYHPTTGEYKGVIVQDGGKLSRVTELENQELSGNAANVVQTTDGTIFFTESNSIRAVRWDTNEVFTVGTFFGEFLEPTPDGKDIWYFEKTGATNLRLHRARPTQGGVDFVDQVTNFAELANPTGILPTTNNIVYQYFTSGFSGLQSRSIGRASLLPTDFSFGGVSNDQFIGGPFRVHADTVYGQFTLPFRVQSIGSDGTGLVDHAAGSWQPAIRGDSMTLGSLTEPVGILFTRNDNSSVQVFDSTSPQTSARTLGFFNQGIAFPPEFSKTSGLTEATASRFGIGTSFLVAIGDDVALIDTRGIGQVGKFADDNVITLPIFPGTAE